MYEYNNHYQGGITNVSNWIPLLIAMERAGYCMKVSQLSYVQLNGKLVNKEGKTCPFAFTSHWLQLGKVTDRPYYGDKEQDVTDALTFIEQVMSAN